MTAPASGAEAEDEAEEMGKGSKAKSNRVRKRVGNVETAYIKAWWSVVKLEELEKWVTSFMLCGIPLVSTRRLNTKLWTVKGILQGKSMNCDAAIPPSQKVTPRSVTFMLGGRLLQSETCKNDRAEEYCKMYMTSFSPCSNPRNKLQILGTDTVVKIPIRVPTPKWVQRVDASFYTESIDFVTSLVLSDEMRTSDGENAFGHPFPCLSGFSAFISTSNLMNTTATSESVLVNNFL